MVIQLVDAEEALRIDVFRPYGATMARCRRMMFASVPMRVVSLEDLAARAATLVLDLDHGEEVPAKHARDFERLIRVIDAHGMEAAWRDHRKPGAPAVFMDAAVRIGALIDARGELLVVPDYSHDGAAVCPTCEETGPFRLASAKAIESILGYC